MKNRKSIVVAKLPNTGLGNKMLTYSRAFSFSMANNLNLYAVNWVSFQIGPVIRMERSKRIYNYFSHSEFLTRIQLYFFSFLRKKEKEGAIFSEYNKYYVFSEIFVRNDYFYEIRENKHLFKDAFFELLNNTIKVQIKNSIAPDIAIHIRRGDFKKGSTITDISYFIEVLKYIKSKINRDLKTYVFSDGNDDELREILVIDGVIRAKHQPDVVDLFQMSKSKIFIPSIGSTFSYWAALFNEGIIIRNELEWHTNFLKEEEFNKKEFIFSNSNDVLADTLKKLPFKL